MISKWRELRYNYIRCKVKMQMGMIDFILGRLQATTLFYVSRRADELFYSRTRCLDEYKR